MALADHVTDRFGSTSPFLIQITNHDNGDAGSINSTRLAEAVSSAEGQFLVYANVTYDDALEQHVDAGVNGVIAYLRMWSSAQGKATPEMEKFRDELRDIAKISSRKRITPVTGVRPRTEGDEDIFHGLTPEFETLSDDGI